MDNFPCKGSGWGLHIRVFCGGRRVKIPRLILPFIVVEYLESAQNKSNPILPSIKGIL